jgi:hypothetical protein
VYRRVVVGDVESTVLGEHRAVGYGCVLVDDVQPGVLGEDGCRRSTVVGVTADDSDRECRDADDCSECGYPEAPKRDEIGGVVVVAVEVGPVVVADPAREVSRASS